MAPSQGLKGWLLDCPKPPTEPHEHMKLKPTKTGHSDHSGPTILNFHCQVWAAQCFKLQQRDSRQKAPKPNQQDPDMGEAGMLVLIQPQRSQKACKGMQKRLKRQRRCKRLQKDAKGTKLQFEKNLGPGLSSLAGVGVGSTLWPTLHNLPWNSQPMIAMLWRPTFSTPHSVQHVGRTLTKRRL